MSESSALSAIGVRTYRPSVFWLSLATAIGVFPLVFVGAGVTSKDAGMAFPDGFTANGYFLQNPPGWTQQEDTLWEHGHRLLGRSVGILAIATLVAAARNRTATVLATASLLAIIAQGVMGALRVEQISRTLAMIHGIWGQVCFALACSMALVSSRDWSAAHRSVALRTGRQIRLTALCASAAILIQLALGATRRHFASDLALVTHIMWAIPVLFLIGWLAMWIVGYGDAIPSRVPKRLAQVIGLLTCLQLFLGGFSWLVLASGPTWSRTLTWLIPTAHVAVGALILVCSVLLTVSVHRWTKPYAPGSAAIPATAVPAA